MTWCVGQVRPTNLDSRETCAVISATNCQAGLRLKELEALSEIAGKVERLTIHNGTGGLMNNLVKLRET